MTLICPKCRSKNIDYMGVLGTEEPRYECRDCGYVGPLVVEDGIAQGNAYSAGDAHLICPNCGSESLEKAAPDARGVSMPGYICRKCGYSGASALKKEAVKTHGGFPYIEILILFFLSMASYVAGFGLQFAVVFFLVLSAVVVLFRYLLYGWRSYPVEDDLKNLDSRGLPKKGKAA